MPREGAPIGLMNVPEPSDFECRWPAEWEPHAATWVAWPHKRNTWPERFDGIDSSRIKTFIPEFSRRMARRLDTESIVVDPDAAFGYAAPVYQAPGLPFPVQFIHRVP